MKVKDKVFIVIGIGILILNISIYSHVKDLQTNMTYTRNELFNIDRSVNSVRNSVNNTLNEIHENSKWLYNGSYSVTNISNDLKNATVALTWSLRTLNNNSKVYLIYRKKPTDKNENDKWTELPIENADNLNYTKELTLSLKNDYEFKVLVKDDKTSTSEKLFNIDFYSMMKDRVQIDLEPRSQSQSDNHVKFSFSGRIRNSYTLPFKYDKSNYDLLKLKNIIVKVSSGDHIKIEFQILKDGKIVDEDTQFGTFHNHRELKLESFEFDKTIEYDIPNDIIEDYIGKNIEIIVEDYSGSTYIRKSHEM
ncbi:hypothetical protein [Oceanirhabdus seepicola]|uniref:Uncharacterized protein n=1 Tax=Oceanirhabdus seepicola TaxID=2828781 RepID=A0A9J6NZ77_9CLOT|nr:hypothetical protein [Oceanirhabdus seepicola]MCM1989209.1 hypothetical protein [Oceanirhabdus seepicola]